MKILIIIPYFGERPAWMDYLLRTCAFNASVEWLFYTDIKVPAECPDNIHFENKTVDDFNRLASRKLDLSVEIYHPYKICDLRPAFGHIFSEYLKDYNIWGYADLDVVFGDISAFLSEDLLEEHDVISVREGYLTGHFALYRNTRTINDLYTKSSMYRKIFQDAYHHYAFDERSSILGRKIYDRAGMTRSLRISQYALSLFRKVRLRMNPALKKMEYPDMSTIVKSLSVSGEIRFYQQDLVRSDLWYEKHGIRQWEIAWKDGTLLDIRTGEKFLHFHFIRSKASPRFHVEPCQTGKEFRIRPTGIKPFGYHG